MKILRLGILGMSDGNGHPYSWSAICNGYNPIAMADCPFPVIPEYLGKQSFPDSALSGVKVTHIWTQQRQLSEHIAQASLIEVVVDDYHDMIGQVDGLLLARDDAEYHLEMSRPFLDAGLPVYIDKPIALSVNELDAILSHEQYPGQVFSCSAMRYAKELQVTVSDYDRLGNIRHVYATVPKKWETYAVHIIEPTLMAIGHQGSVEQVTATRAEDKFLVNVVWQSGVTATFAVLGKTACNLSMTLYGSHTFKEYVFRDAFAAFKTSLAAFLDSIQRRKRIVPYLELKAVVEIIERGMG